MNFKRFFLNYKLGISVLFLIVVLVLINIFATNIFAAKKLTIAHCMPENHPYDMGCQKFGELIEEKTNGRFELIIYPNAQMGTEHQIAEMCSAGTLDFACVWPGGFEQYSPLTGVTRLPFLFDSWEQYWKAIDGEIGAKVYKELLQNNIEVLPSFVNGKYNIVSKMPIETPEDAKGKKFRVQPSAVVSKLFETLGCIVSPISFGEVYTALQLGTVDAEFQSPVNTYQSSHFEVAGYTTETEMAYFIQCLAVNSNIIKGFSEEDQKAIRDAAQEAAIWQREYAYKETEEDIKLLKEKGMVFFTADKNLWREATASIYDYYYKLYPEWEDIVEKIKSIKQ